MYNAETSTKSPVKFSGGQYFKRNKRGQKRMNQKREETMTKQRHKKRTYKKRKITVFPKSELP